MNSALVDLLVNLCMMCRVRRINGTLVAFFFGCLLACEEQKPKQEVAKAAAEEESEVPVAAPPKGPPELAVDDISPKVGYSRVVIKEDRDRMNLRTELAAYKEYLFGKEVPLLVDRKSSIRIVNMYLDELSEIGVAGVVVRTETRREYPAEVRFIPQKRASSPAPCTTVAMILEDRGTAVWKLSGGTASKRAHGLGGPDLSMTLETLERYFKGCKEGKRLYVAAPEGVGWGLLFDLAASAHTLVNLKPEATVLLNELPVPGHKVDL